MHGRLRLFCHAGAFVMGCGLMVQEQVIIDSATGKLLTDGTWTYKIPTAACIPRQLNVEFLKVPHPKVCAAGAVCSAKFCWTACVHMSVHCLS